MEIKKGSKRYTRKMHMGFLRVMLDKYDREEIDRLRDHCPCTLDHALFIHSPCGVCVTFVGMPRRYRDRDCPCGYYGCQEAIRITREKLNAER